MFCSMLCMWLSFLYLSASITTDLSPLIHSFLSISRLLLQAGTMKIEQSICIKSRYVGSGQVSRYEYCQHYQTRLLGRKGFV
jgi:hypothetical protein